MGDKKKLLFWGDGPMVTTGFGTVNRHIARALHDTGRYEIDFIGVNYWGDPYDPEEYPYRVWPGGIEKKSALQTGFGDAFGGPNFGFRYWSDEYDGVFILNDINVLAERLAILKTSPTGTPTPPSAPIIYYFPIDAYFLHEGWLPGVEHADAPVTYNEFSKEMVGLVNPAVANRCKVIPHGTDIESFRVEEKESVMAFRRDVMKVDDETVLFVQVARNQVRKSNGDIILAYHGFKEANPDIKSHLYFHMHPEDNGPHQHAAVLSLGMEVGEGKDVSFKEDHNPGRAVGVDVLNMIYNAADIFVTATLGEGWGLPVTEAMATMTPVIAPHNTSLSEMLNIPGAEEAENSDLLRGWPVKCGEGPQGMVQVDGTGFRPRVSVNNLTNNMTHVAKMILEDRAGNTPDELKVRLDNAMAYAEEIAWPNVCKKWVELFDEVI
jgi:glycosyltransferase involved in cell wall biosynthesis